MKMSRPFRIWEVVSVIQDLSGSMKTELDWRWQVLLRMPIDSELLQEPAFGYFFRLSDHEIKNLLTEKSSATVETLRSITRLTAVFILFADHTNTVTDEYADYFETFDDDMLIAAWRICPTHLTRLLEVLRTAIFNHVLKHGLTDFMAESVLFTASIGDRLFSAAVANDNLKLLSEIIERAWSRDLIERYTRITILYRKVEYLKRVLARSDVITEEDLLESRENLLESIAEQTFEHDDLKTLVEMLLMIAPESGLEEYSLLLDNEDTEFSVEFALQSLDRFDWSEIDYIQTPAIRETLDDVLNNQV